MTEYLSTVKNDELRRRINEYCREIGIVKKQTVNELHWSLKKQLKLIDMENLGFRTYKETLSWLLVVMVVEGGFRADVAVIQHLHA